MCGHVGVAGKLEHKDEALMKRLLVLDYFRGPDSTGLASIRKSGDVKIAKLAANPLDLFDTQKFKDTLSGHASRVFLGHNRAATKGAVNNQNAHPYQYGHIVGAHNGTLDKSSWDALNKMLDEPTDVDSQAIFACIEKHGIEETIKVMQGAWALVWIDLNEGTLNFLRNKERPFWYSYDEKYDRVFWASEWPMMQAAVKLSSVEYKMAIDAENHSYYRTVENWWYRYDLKSFDTSSERPKPRVKELHGKEAVVTTYSGPFSGYGQGNRVTPPVTHQSASHGTTTSTTTSSHGTVPPVSIRNFNVSKENPFLGYISRDRFNEMSTVGCSWCRKLVDYDMVGLSIDDRLDNILCPDCTGNHNHTRVYVTGDLRDIHKILVADDGKQIAA